MKMRQCDNVIMSKYINEAMRIITINRLRVIACTMTNDQ